MYFRTIPPFLPFLSFPFLRSRAIRLTYRTSRPHLFFLAARVGSLGAWPGVRGSRVGEFGGHGRGPGGKPQKGGDGDGDGARGRGRKPYRRGGGVGYHTIRYDTTRYIPRTDNNTLVLLQRGRGTRLDQRKRKERGPKRDQSHGSVRQGPYKPIVRERETLFFPFSSE
jgi:hypothetical protein